MNQEKALTEYYQNEFSLSPLVSVIDTTDFHKREFGFVQLNGHFIRNYSFASPTSLLYFLQTRPLLHVYVGAVYEGSPSQENPINTLNWVRRELIFDIDLNDFDLVRKKECGCQLDRMCLQCWEEHIKPSVYFIEDTLREDFGFKMIKWTYSGRRGVHAWIQDKNSHTLNSEQRASIIRYLSLINSDNIIPIKELPRRLWGRVFTWIVKHFFLSASIEDLVSLGFPQERAYSITISFQKKEISEHTIGRLLTLSKFGEKKAMQEILFRRLPRIDQKVTVDISRILRMPGSIHGATGKPVLILDISHIDDFNPFNVPSIF
ncbi:MAG: DNA primase catalytic subunit PriS [Candidatus Hodarchaeota archaeon]